jgi:hypothetical protein
LLTKIRFQFDALVTVLKGEHVLVQFDVAGRAVGIKGVVVGVSLDGFGVLFDGLRESALLEQSISSFFRLLRKHRIDVRRSVSFLFEFFNLQKKKKRLTKKQIKKEEVDEQNLLEEIQRLLGAVFRQRFVQHFNGQVVFFLLEIGVAHSVQRSAHIQQSERGIDREMKRGSIYLAMSL